MKQSLTIFAFVLSLLVGSGGYVFAAGDNISCEAVLISFDRQYRWSQRYDDGRFEDGFAPFALFIVRSPESISGRKVGIMFKSRIHSNVLKNIDQKIGKEFVLVLPGNFFERKNQTIDAFYVSEIYER